jgi:hypothetical protein
VSIAAFSVAWSSALSAALVRSTIAPSSSNRSSMDGGGAARDAAFFR